MKKSFFLLSILALIIFGCSKPKKNGYIFLNAEQLKPLGIELSENGIFYKNYDPKWVDDKQKFSCLGFYSTRDFYMASFHFKETDTLKANNRNDSLLILKERSNNDFYPILIGNIKGQYSLDSEEKNIELLPIAICMSETRIPDRTDTLVVWFKTSESMKKLLPSGVLIEDYLRLPDKKK